MEAKRFSAKDITYVLTVRVSDFTPWILERIRFQLNFYSPCPQILVLDFGSEQQYSDLIEAECQRKHIQYIKVEDHDTFSAAKAKNIAYQHVKTDLLLLSDVDCVFDRDIFQKLAKDATLLELDINPRRYITFPVTHLGEEISANFSKLDGLNQEKYLKQLDFYSNQSTYGKEIEFIAPYSNILFMHKKLYDLSGGYCDIFRGHGSEDFEYLIRLGYLTSDIPKPKNLNKDFYGPLKSSFWGETTYEGFRKYLEALTFTSETLGYRTYHLWHPKPSDKGYWTNNNDWKRERFNNILGIYLQQEEKILEIDYQPRQKKALCLMNDPDQWGYFLPLRTLGYSLEVASRNNQTEIHQAYKKIKNQAYDLVCIFNPYMKSHKNYFDLIELAKSLNIPVKIIERGALPHTIYYADEVAYNDPDYYNESKIHQNIFNKTLSTPQINEIESYINRLKQGGSTLEHMQDYDASIAQLKSLVNPLKTNIFIPLQLPDDMAVNYFNEGYQSYEAFISEIKISALKYPHIQFYLKPHPLMPNVDTFKLIPNITLLSDLNIHAILNTFDHIVVYNSGVGLLSIIHNKKPYCVGNAFYSLNGRLATKVIDIHQAIENILDTHKYPILNSDEVNQFLHWLYFEKYSVFSAQDKLRDFGERLSHGYKNIQIQRFNFEDKIEELNSNSLFNFSEKSYLSAKMMLSRKSKPAPKADTKSTPAPTVKAASKPASAKVAVKEAIVEPIISEPLYQKKIRKLLREPKVFLRDAIRNKAKLLDLSA